ncbi:MAG: hypothetical protein MZV65_29865 [Chromatiales bacterium]|nr:hypothetical protein [Chromatiales bacterium]
MFDCGEGTQRQPMASSISFMKITSIFITHHRGDHFLGLPGLIQSMNFYGREVPLHVYGPEGTGENDGGHPGFGDIFDRKYEVEGHDLTPGDVVNGDGYKVISKSKANHTTPALGHAFQEDDRPGRFDAGQGQSVGDRRAPSFSRPVEGSSVKVGSSTITPEMVMGPPQEKGSNLFTAETLLLIKSWSSACLGADVLIHEATVASDLETKAREFGHSTAMDAALLASVDL